MSSISAAGDAPAREVDLLSNPVAWVWEMIVYAVGLAISALLLGGVLNLTWNDLAGAFSFMEPLGDYWNCVLASLGAYGAFLVLESARAGRTTNVLRNLGESANVAGRIGVLLVLAWIASQL